MFKRNRLFITIFSIVLLCFTVYVLADTFLITRVYSQTETAEVSETEEHPGYTVSATISGDSSRSAAERETREELGLFLDLSAVRPSLTIHWENGFDDYYLLTRDVDIRSLHLQAEEVQAVCWASKEKILRMIDSGEFIPYEKSLIELLFFRKDHRSSHTRSDPTND